MEGAAFRTHKDQRKCSANSSSSIPFSLKTGMEYFRVIAFPLVQEASWNGAKAWLLTIHVANKFPDTPFNFLLGQAVLLFLQVLEKF